MKAKFLTLSILLAGSCVFANAQEKKNYYTKKASDNIFVGVGVGGMSVLNGGLNTPTMNFNLQVGKYITPTWEYVVKLVVCGRALMIRITPILTKLQTMNTTSIARSLVKSIWMQC